MSRNISLPSLNLPQRGTASLSNFAISCMRSNICRNVSKNLTFSNQNSLKSTFPIIKKLELIVAKAINLLPIAVKVVKTNKIVLEPFEKTISNKKMIVWCWNSILKNANLTTNPKQLIVLRNRILGQVGKK
jgi:hypothetical protein